MKKLYFVRHGESFVNIEDIFGTRPGAPNDKGLTENGQAQAHKAGQQAKTTGFMPDLIVASPLTRAQETALIIAKEIGYPTKAIITTPLVVELQFGSLEQTSWKAFWEAGNTYENLEDFEGAETIEAMQKRAEEALAFLENRPENTILVVSHSAFGRALRRVIDGQPYTLEFSNKVSLPHGEILEYV